MTGSKPAYILSPAWSCHLSHGLTGGEGLLGVLHWILREADSETMFGMQDFDEGVPLGSASVGGKQDWAEDDIYKQPLGPL